MNAASLFSNCGPGDIGFAAARFDSQVISEIVEKRLAVATLGHPDAVPVPGDLRRTWPNVVDKKLHGLVLAALAQGRETPATLSQDDRRWCQRALVKLRGG